MTKSNRPARNRAATPSEPRPVDEGLMNAKRRNRTIELMEDGVDAVDAATQAAREFPDAPSEYIFEVSFAMRARDAAFIKEVCANDDQKVTLVKTLIARARAEWNVANPNRYASIGHEAASVPRQMFNEKAGL